MKIKRSMQCWITFLGSNRFFYVVVGLFLAGSVWLVFTSRYPMAFDENYHYEIIQTYAKQWGPFFSSPPAGTAQLGDITRYPSYLYHYLMSFPYRFFSIFIHSDTTKIILLRLMNVAFLASSFWIFKRLFEQFGLSKTIANLALFVFALIPIVPFLGAQISYDNATIPLTALTFLAVFHILKPLQKGVLRLDWLIGFLSIGLFTSLVKYTYLPIFVVLFIYVVIALLWAYHKNRLHLLKTAVKDFQGLPKVRSVLLCAGLILGLLLCFERYGINVLRYKNPVPDCNQVLSTQSCMQYGPWARDYRLKLRRQTVEPQWRIVDYHKFWQRTLLYEFFFAINHEYSPKDPLKVLYSFSLTTLRVAAILSLLFVWKILRHPALRLFAVTSAFYIMALWIDNYLKFYSVHWPVAIHGRYLLPLVPIMAVVFGYSFWYLIGLLPKSLRLTAQAVLSGVLVVLMLFGGGALTYITRSDASWYQENDFVIHVNSALHNLFSRVLK